MTILLQRFRSSE